MKKIDKRVGVSRLNRRENGRFSIFSTRVFEFAAWIRFPSLPGYLYNHKILTEIGELVGKVVKLDMNTDSRAKGYFVRMAVYVNLEKPLVSQILINGQSQKVEYESLSTICFHCGRYDHVENFCTFRNYGPFVEKKIDSLETIPKNQNMVMDELVKKDENCGPWMIVKRKSRREFRDNVQKSLGNQERKKEGSHFRILNNRDLNKEVYDGDLSDSRRSKGKEIINGPGSVGSAWSGISGPAKICCCW
ncbi:hypothetical protein Goarm_019304 [Gossypium armourianum]|uniref:DUF4283 domain-containing protein n=1 Tax=Gossypium armourianum TaxID=34283 RepID=A0A7J9IK38_9ROSI|nr:hypothetical protein [Gossypium armourianum]